MDHLKDEGRRKFLRTLGRALLALGLGGGVAALVSRDPEKCTNQGLCRGCSELADCRLPQALSLKEALGRTSRHG